MRDFLYQSFSKTRGDQIVWRLDSGRLRILCYHGICLDRLAFEPWMPSCFVAQTPFASQLQYLRDNANVLPLEEGLLDPATQPVVAFIGVKPRDQAPAAQLARLVNLYLGALRAHQGRCLAHCRHLCPSP